MLGDAEEFVRLRTSGEPDDYHRAAHEEASNATWLHVIAEYPDMRFWVAQNKTVPNEILRVLAKDDDSRVRRMVAMKRKLESSILEGLASDVDDSVRMSVARHRNATRSVLEKLAQEDPCAEVQRTARARL